MPVNVTTITSSLDGGAGKAALRLHQALRKIPEIEAVLVQNTLDPAAVDAGHIQKCPPRSASFFEKVLFKFGVDVRQSSLQKEKVLSEAAASYEAVSFPYTEFRCEDMPAVENADLVHLHWVGNFINYPTFFKKIKAPVVWTLHDMNPFMGMYHYEGDRERNAVFFENEEKKLIEIKRKALAGSPDIHIVCLTDWLMEKSKKSSILGKYPHYLIPNGLDLAAIKFLQKQEAKRVAGIGSDKKTLLCVAQDINHPRKGFDIFVEAISLMGDTAFNVITVGGNAITFPDNIRNYHFDRIDDENKLNELYAAADLVVLPSREDNLPNIMLEAFANGTPVLSFATGGMKEWIKPGVNGVLAKPFEAISLADEVLRFCNDEYEFDAAAIRAFAETNFEDKKQVSAYVNLYHQILGQ